ncbi:ABC transporter ATP-binding protein [Microbaculum marinisediminis]|uniref:ATP-binding cassette domain-containing protein n=1 Tax=Microbaculum marinisediminis TaxID=2931392 RepID=A0AAW5QTH4_9HYPH|nr:oligopeptide/dipeptide ABC transporter ATP-binding protein [Microbaculum sp. A6E488]MCT8970968.1 ATP-binding cassette domain-containing protein [Microbaculum sp. A6E488]
MSARPLIEIDNVVRDYALPRPGLFQPHPLFRAVHGVSLAIESGRSLGLIGESGCGKSTLARIVLALDRPTEGTVRLDGEDLFSASRARLAVLRRRMQIVFQDPYGSLDPRHKVGWIVAEPLSVLAPDLSRGQRRQRVAEVLDAVGLSSAHADRYPHEFSGGQRQRIAIARALVTGPDLIVADEPVSALDVSIQAQILNLMMELREARGVTFLFISHDLTVVNHVTDDVAVMYLGRVVEQGPTSQVFAAPAHPYTQLLLSAVPKPDPAFRRRATGVPVEPPAAPAEGACPFAPRCPRATEICRMEEPALEPHGAGRTVACFHPVG